VKGPHEERWFGLTCGVKRLLLYEGGERGTAAPHGLHTIADTIGPDGWHTSVAAWLNLQASSCHRAFTRTLNTSTTCLFPCLQSMADALPDMAIAM
jgi:hypothetical protein